MKRWTTIMTGLLAVNVMADDDVTAKRLEQLETRLAELERQEQPAGGVPTHALYQDGLRFTTADKAYNVQFGGRLQMDSIYADADDAVEARTGEIGHESGIRRALIKGMGTIHSNLDYLILFNLANDEVVPLDNFLQLRGIPVVQRIRAGHFREPMGLDAIASSRDILFMERAPVVLALAPFYNVGAGIIQNRLDNRLYACAAVFQETDTQARSTGNDGYHATGRLTGLPWVSEDAKRFVHVGASASYQSQGTDTTRYGGKPGSFFLPTFVDTKSISNCEHAVLVGTEMAAVFGRALIQAEYLQSDLAYADTSALFGGWYAQAAWFLTSDTHPFDRQNALFSRLRPAHPFTNGSGPGAWEVVARYSELDLNDGPVHGGEIANTTAGMNWYLDANTRLAFNYVHAELADVGGADIYAMRMQLDF